LSGFQKRRGRGEADSRNISLIGFVDCLLFVVCEWQFLFCSVPTVMHRLQCNGNVHNVMDRIFGKNQPIMKKIWEGNVVKHLWLLKEKTHSMGYWLQWVFVGWWVIITHMVHTQKWTIIAKECVHKSSKLLAH
jgi:hypothetical protein